MAYEEKDQSGSLFKNDRKERDSQPDYTGKGIVNGVPVYISGWVKEGNGKKFFSLAFKNRQEGGFGAVEKKPAPTQLPDDEIPF